MSRINKIVIACDSFKGSCSAVDVTAYLERGLKRVRPELEVVKVPVADGGEGTVDRSTGTSWIWHLSTHHKTEIWYIPTAWQSRKNRS